MKSGNDDEKIDLERDGHGREEERPHTADSDSTKSTHTQTESLHEIQPVVTLGEPLGNIETKSVHRSRTQSRASSTRSRALTIIPRSKRRGLLGSLTLVPEVSNPHDYKRSTKWGLVCIIALATAAAPLGSTVVYRTYFPLYTSYTALHGANRE